MDTDTPTHAGGVVYRSGRDHPLFLLVTAKRDPQRWILPKGHIEPEETAEVAALREVREEGGAEGDIVGELGRIAVDTPEEREVIRYFLVRALRVGASHEGRQTAWLEREAAEQRLDSDAVRGLLRKAAALVEAADD